MASNLSVQDGYQGLVQFVQRCRRNKPRFEDYQSAHCFGHSASFLRRFLLFARLNLPTNTFIDLREFLVGAHQAGEHILNAIHSAEFIEYCARQMNGDQDAEWNHEAFASCTAAQWLANALSPCEYQRVVTNLQEMLQCDRKAVAPAHQIDIQSVYLDSVDWDRLRKVEFDHERYEQEQEIQSSLFPQDESHQKVVVDIGAADASTTKVEVLRLFVRMNYLLHFRVAREIHTWSANGLLGFESLVTTPEELDWRLMSFAVLHMRLVAVRSQDQHQ